MTSLWEWLFIAGLVLALVVLLLSTTATRLDRLHHKVEATRAALDVELVRRAAAARSLATSGLLDPARGLLVASAAVDALAAGDEPTSPDADLTAERQARESELTQALRAALPDSDEVQEWRAHAPTAVLADDLAQAAHRAGLARRFHNEAVTQAQRVRGKRLVRWAHLAGRAPMPQTTEIDDTVPSLRPPGSLEL